MKLSKLLKPTIYGIVSITGSYLLAKDLYQSFNQVEKELNEKIELLETIVRDEKPFSVTKEKTMSAALLVASTVLVNGVLIYTLPRLKNYVHAEKTLSEVIKLDDSPSTYARF